MGLINEVMYAMLQRNKYCLAKYIIKDLKFEDDSDLFDYQNFSKILDTYGEYLADK